MTRFVELVRVSTTGQADRDTPDIQRTALDKLRKSRPGTLVERIEALGLSGALPLNQRPDLLRLQELAGKYDEVRVYSIDRLTRQEDPKERWAIYSMVAENKARIVDINGSVTDPADDMGEMQFFFHGLASSRERKRIIARTMDGKRRAVAAGRHPHGSPPYGRKFDKVAGVWSLDKERAKVYRKLFDLYLAGKSATEIIEHLRSRNIPPPRSRRSDRWAKSTLLKMLKHRSAIGEYKTFGRTKEVPPVVSVEVFDAVQRMLTSSSFRSGRPAKHSGAILRKLLACGMCGRTMYVDNDRSGKAQVYVCRARREHHNCPEPRQHQVSTVDPMVKAYVSEILGHPGRQEKAISRDPSAGLRESIAEAEAALVELDGEEERLARLARRRLLSDKVLEKQAAEIYQLRAAAEQRLRTSKATLRVHESGSGIRDQLEARMRDFRLRIKTASPSEWRWLVGEIFPRGTGSGLRIYPDGHLEGVGGVVLSPGNKGNERSTLSARSVQFPVTINSLRECVSGPVSQVSLAADTNHPAPHVRA